MDDPKIETAVVLAGFGVLLILVSVTALAVRGVYADGRGHEAPGAVLSELFRHTR